MAGLGAALLLPSEQGPGEGPESTPSRPTEPQVLDLTH